MEVLWDVRLYGNVVWGDFGTEGEQLAAHCAPHRVSQRSIKGTLGRGGGSRRMHGKVEGEVGQRPHAKQLVDDGLGLWTCIGGGQIGVH